MSVKAQFSLRIVHNPYAVVLRDENKGGTTITNDAEAVIAHLYDQGWLRHGVPCLYWDTDGQLDELVHRDERFVGFAPVPRAVWGGYR